MAARSPTPVDAQRVGDDVANASSGAAARCTGPERRSERAGAVARHRPAVTISPTEANLAAGRPLQEEQRLHQGRLAATALADETERLALPSELNETPSTAPTTAPRCRPRSPVAYGEVLREFRHLEQRAVS